MDSGIVFIFTGPAPFFCIALNERSVVREAHPRHWRQNAEHSLSGNTGQAVPVTCLLHGELNSPFMGAEVGRGKGCRAGSSAAGCGTLVPLGNLDAASANRV